ncbi:GcvT family protein [Nonomuraea endophytica]|uniref:4-methylaminobutanoate oxidase (Formaldehyde-forming) n=1 Tax=Nonomuraea endophytica TaxID=714136 RepID=A0A7W7ZYI8_9ACTN|nr:FAD-dependent oxidoreductase [Nonomuraea endophytica]MBB5076200.1 4-methylaminobutanoate oxidase (formaldehyde-forming) [Nonomuraea endophytica]
MKALPSRAQVVIIGGGIVGASVAYHLAELGWTDVVVLEQGQLSCGTTWHAAGLVGQLRSTESMTRLIQYSTDLYARLEAETGFGTGWKQCGSVSVARTAERMTQLRRTAAQARNYGVTAEIITPTQAQELWPVMRVDDVVGGVWLPGDGKANPSDLTQALARGAQRRGVQVVERVRVTGVTVKDGVVKSVSTSEGEIETDYVVNCAGQWAKEIGRMAGVTVPLHSAEHFYVVTEQIEGVRPDLPVLRDPDGYAYFKEEVGGLVVGGFEPDAKPWGMDGIPYPFEFQLLEEDWDQFSIIMENAIHRVPALETTGVRMFYNGPESFTPDNMFLLGAAPEVRGFFVGAGFNSAGIASAGGAGRALAEWIVNGAPTSDLWPADLRRFARWADNDTWLRDRVTETLGLHYAMSWPNKELETARPLRRSPVHHLLAAAGACFGSKMGWERANYFGTAAPYTFARPEWQPQVNAEIHACRTQAALFDQTSFGKFTLKGRDAAAALQWLCTADVDVEVGRVVYTGLLNDRGGYESDLTVTRVAHDEYLIVTGSAQSTRDFDVISKGLGEHHAVLVDVTGTYAVFSVMGPKSREILQSVSKADFSAFAVGTSRLVDLGYATVRATRMTYVGELGWELYVPSEFAVTVYETLLTTGLTQAGYYAIEAMRIEKGYRAWGRELGPEVTPAAAGLRFACKKTGGYRGADRAMDDQGRHVVSIVLDDPEAHLWGGESLLRDGEPVGYVTSAAYSPTLGASVALGFVSDATMEKAQVDVAGEMYSAQISRKAPYDPTSSRVKA